MAGRPCGLLRSERLLSAGQLFTHMRTLEALLVSRPVCRACTVLLRLSAAGAPPAARPPVPAGAFSDSQWAELNASATQRIAWGPSTRRYYPRAFRAAVAQLLLVSQVAGFGSSRQGPASGGTCGGRPQGGVWLDGNLVACVTAQLGRLQG